LSVFSDRLCQAVEENNISWADLARRTKLSTARISQYKTGLYTPKSESLYLIAEALNVNPDWLGGMSDSKECYPTYRYLQDLTPFDMRLLNAFHKSDDSVKQGICVILGLDSKGTKIVQTREFSEDEINNY